MFDNGERDPATFEFRYGRSDSPRAADVRKLLEEPAP